MPTLIEWGPSNLLSLATFVAGIVIAHVYYRLQKLRRVDYLVETNVPIVTHGADRAGDALTVTWARTDC